MSETRFSQGRSKSSANIPPLEAGNAHWIDRSPLAMRGFPVVPIPTLSPAPLTAFNPQDPNPIGSSKSYNPSPNGVPNGPLPCTRTHSPEESIRDEFWLGPLVVLVAIVWLRLALDAMGVLPMNLGY